MPNHLPPASGRCAHKIYGMACDDYDRLVVHADGRCQVCGITAEETNRGFLVVDHDALVGQWAVRGLLCSDCNTAIPCGSAPSWARGYLANPWWKLQGLSQPGPTAGDGLVSAVATASKRYAAAEDDLRATILEALRAPDAKPTKVAAASPWTPAYVRAFARKNGIEPDPSYKDRTRKKAADQD